MFKIYIDKYQDFLKYLVVGILNLGFTFLVYYFFLRILKANYLISFSVSWICGVAFTYVINAYWVFKAEDAVNFTKSFPKYLIIYFCSFLFNIWALKFVTDTLNFDPLLGQFLIIPFIIVINFLGMKYWSFRN